MNLIYDRDDQSPASVLFHTTT